MQGPKRSARPTSLSREDRDLKSLAASSTFLRSRRRQSSNLLSQHRDLDRRTRRGFSPFKRIVSSPCPLLPRLRLPSQLPQSCLRQPTYPGSQHSSPIAPKPPSPPLPSPPLSVRRANLLPSPIRMSAHALITRAPPRQRPWLASWGTTARSRSVKGTRRSCWKPHRRRRCCVLQVRRI